MKDYAMVVIGAMPLRKEPSEKSEMTTQLLFNDMVQFFDSTGNWVKVHCLFDEYEGWMDAKTLKFIDKSDISTINSPVLNTIFAWVKNNQGEKILIPGGSFLYNYNDTTGDFFVGNETYHLEEKFIPSVLSREQTVILAKQYLNCPYLWGGKTAFGIDCSGLVQVVYKMLGIFLLRDAAQQVNHGTVINFVEEALPGDLFFFDNDEGNIVHVGIYAGNGKIIHASGKVRIDSIDNQGIFREDIKKYTHKLRVIKRILE